MCENKNKKKGEIEKIVSKMKRGRKGQGENTLIDRQMRG